MAEGSWTASIIGLEGDEEHWTGERATWKACLWFLAIAFMFFCQHHVCDCYFVPAINVFVSKMRKSEIKCARRWGDDAVAGATICALGCNGPELFSNLISLFTHSDAGLGVVVGSEIFNLLIIVGCAALFAPVTPLALERVPFARDCCFYAVSIVLLYVCMKDKSISFDESCILLGMAAVYVACVYFTEDFVNCIPALRPANVPIEAVAPAKKGKMHGIEVEVTQILHSRMADGRQEESEKFKIDAEANGINAIPAEGNPSSVKRQRSMDYASNRRSVGFQYAGSEDPMLGAMMKYKDLKEVVIMAEGIINLEFYSGLGHVTLQFNCGDSSSRDELLSLIKLHSYNKPYIHGYDATVIGAFTDLKNAMTGHHTLMHKILAIPEFLVDFLLKLTLFWCDVKDIKREKFWPLCFCGAMFWLATFSFLMLSVANEITYNTNGFLSEAFLGITVCAIGTSFPNAVASIIMAKQNKPAAAVANALGSNVQNVFLAMALPWVIYAVSGGGTVCKEGTSGCLTKFGFNAIPQEADDIVSGVLWMMGTLVLVVVLVLLQGLCGKPCTINKATGYILILVFVAYLILTSYNSLFAK